MYKLKCISGKYSSFNMINVSIEESVSFNDNGDLPMIIKIFMGENYDMLKPIDIEERMKENIPIVRIELSGSVQDERVINILEIDIIESYSNTESQFIFDSWKSVLCWFFEKSLVKLQSKVIIDETKFEEIITEREYLNMGFKENKPDQMQSLVSVLLSRCNDRYETIKGDDDGIYAFLPVLIDELEEAEKSSMNQVWNEILRNINSRKGFYESSLENMNKILNIDENKFNTVKSGSVNKTGEELFSDFDLNELRLSFESIKQTTLLTLLKRIIEQNKSNEKYPPMTVSFISKLMYPVEFDVNDVEIKKYVKKIFSDNKLDDRITKNAIKYFHYHLKEASDLSDKWENGFNGKESLDTTIKDSKKFALENPIVETKSKYNVIISHPENIPILKSELTNRRIVELDGVVSNAKKLLNSLGREWIHKNVNFPLEEDFEIKKMMENSSDYEKYDDLHHEYTGGVNTLLGNMINEILYNLKIHYIRDTLSDTPKAFQVVKMSDNDYLKDLAIIDDYGDMTKSRRLSKVPQNTLRNNFKNIEKSISSRGKLRKKKEDRKNYVFDIDEFTKPINSSVQLYEASNLLNEDEDEIIRWGTVFQRMRSNSRLYHLKMSTMKIMSSMIIDLRYIDKEMDNLWIDLIMKLDKIISDKNLIEKSDISKNDNSSLNLLVDTIFDIDNEKIPEIIEINTICRYMKTLLNGIHEMYFEYMDEDLESDVLDMFNSYVRIEHVTNRYDFDIYKKFSIVREQLNIKREPLLFLDKDNITKPPTIVNVEDVIRKLHPEPQIVEEEIIEEKKETSLVEIIVKNSLEMGRLRDRYRAIGMLGNI